ncbi:UNVERIFIED_CONTAM: hypothetical protein FKN15_011340 [Acipenser sinensis]
MDVSVSVSFFQDELASTIEHAVKAAVDTVLCEITKVVGGKFTEFQMQMAGKEKENESLKLRLEISESELKAVRECMNAADADIKQPLRNMNPDCNVQDFQRNENQGLSQGNVKRIIIGLPSGASSKGPPRGVQDAHYSLDIASSSPGYSFADRGQELPGDGKLKRAQAALTALPHDSAIVLQCQFLWQL